jgi:hypothetical protein
MRQKKNRVGTCVVMAFKVVSPPSEVVITVPWTGTGEAAAVHYVTI